MITVTTTYIKSELEKGEYIETEIDQLKKEVDFRIMQMSPIYIRWNDGRGQIVTSRKLNALKKNHSWTTDF